jgi:hypothetical protein
MKKKNTTPSDKVYKLTRDAAPLSYMLPTKNTRRFPLLYFDEEQNTNRALRYSINQKSPFEDEQDGNAILEPVIFEDGFLRVPKNNPVLQEFLYYHPMNGSTFVEVDNEKDAAKEIENLNSEVDALIEARNLTVDQLETLGRVLFGRDTTKMTTAELRRDMLVYAKKSPHSFLNAMKDPMLKLQSNVHRFFDARLLVFKNNRKDVFFNTASNKKKMITIPYGQDPMYVVASYLQSDDGIEVLKFLETELEMVGS